MTMVPVATFTYPAEAFALMAMLDSEGIENQLFNQNTVNSDPFLSNSIGGVRLMVREEDFEKAKPLVEAFLKPAVPNFIPDGPDWQENYDPIQTWCPRCEAIPVYAKKFSLGKNFITAAIAVLVSPIFVLSRPMKCARCGHSWNQ